MMERAICSLFSCGRPGTGDLASQFLVGRQRSPLLASADLLHMAAKVLQQDAAATQVAFHPLLVADGTQRSTEYQAVEAGQNSHDLITAFRDKLVHGVLLRIAVNSESSAMIQTKENALSCFPGSSTVTGHHFWLRPTGRAAFVAVASGAELQGTGNRARVILAPGDGRSSASYLEYARDPGIWSIRPFRGWLRGRF